MSRQPGYLEKRSIRIKIYPRLRFTNIYNHSFSLLPDFMSGKVPIKYQDCRALVIVNPQNLKRTELTCTEPQGKS